MHKKNVGIAGSQGRMGREIIDCLQTDERFLWKTSRSSAQDPIEKLFENVDVVIDFSVKESFEDHCQTAEKFKIPLVVGTTGITYPSYVPQIPLFISPNMSISVGVMTKLTEQLSSFFPEFDIEIAEAHHRHKRDAPSGTALMLGQSAAQGRAQPLVISIDRSGVRSQNTIGFSVMRGGDLPGEHRVHFIGQDEQIILSHICYSRRVFAKGALDIAHWLTDKDPGLYTMDHFLKDKYHV